MIDSHYGTVYSRIADRVLHIQVSDELELLWVGAMHKNDEHPIHDFVNGDCFTLQFVSQGALKLLLNEEPLTVYEGECVLIWPNEECRALEAGSDLVCQWLRFSVHRSRSQRCREGVRVCRLAKISNPGRASELLRLIAEEFHGRRHFCQVDELPRFDQPLRFLLLSLLSRIGLEEPERPLISGAMVALAERGKDYIRSNRRKPITSAEVAVALDCSPRYLRKAFRHAYGYSPTTFLLQTRLFEARRLLVETHLSVTEVARECGFGSLNYFTRAFKSFHGTTPTDYRASYSHRYVAPSF